MEIIMRFRKKPIIIEAWHYTGEDSLHHMDRPGWFCVALNRGDIEVHHDHLAVPTLEGEMRADLGDWIIQGVKKEIYPCKPDVFDATYEVADIAIASGDKP
jgi:hypothetical protein